MSKPSEPNVFASANFALTPFQPDVNFGDRLALTNSPPTKPAISQHSFFEGEFHG
jgi:hypothetical protein